MNQEIQLKVRLFGAFRNLSSSSEIQLVVLSGASIGDVKKELGRHLGSHSKLNIEGLLAQSVLANDSKILEEADEIQNGMMLSILPPVCGG